MYPLCIKTTDIFYADEGTIKYHDVVELDEIAVVVIDNVEALSVVDFDIEELITDCSNRIVKVKQPYKNKATFVSAMHNYAIKHEFNFRAERSDKQR